MKELLGQLEEDHVKHKGRTAVNFIKIEERLGGIEKRLDLLPRIMEMLEGITKDIKDLKQEQVLMVNWLKDHNYRIEAIENKLGIINPPKLLRQL